MRNPNDNTPTDLVLIPIQHMSIGIKTIPAVDARELHQKLALQKDFSSWIKKYTESGDWLENIDFVVFTQEGENPQRGRPTTEYALCLRMAEHIAMMTRSKRGAAVRDYFRKARDERDALTPPSVALTPLDILHELTGHLRQQQQEIAEIRDEQQALRHEVHAIEARKPPPGRLLIADWIGQNGKPRLYGEMWTAIKARCKTIETPVMFRPEGMDYPLPFYTPATIARAYTEVTRQISFIHEAPTRYGRRTH